MRVLIASDLHLMCLINKLNELICKERVSLALSGLLNVIERKQPDYTVIAGDLLNKYSQSSIAIQEYINEAFHTFVATATHYTKLLILAGNHDKSGDFSGLQRYEFLSNFTDIKFFNHTHAIVKTPFEYDILMIPYGVSLSKVVKDRNNKKQKIGFGHFMVNGCVYDNLMEVQKAMSPKGLYTVAKALNVKEFFIGDNHKRQVIYDKDNFKAMHIGSMMQTKINESTKSYAILWDSEKDSQLFRIPNLYMVKVFTKSEAFKISQDPYAIGLTSDVDLCISDNIVLDLTVNKTKMSKKEIDEFDYNIDVSVDLLLKKYIAKHSGRDGVRLLKKAKAGGHF